MNTHGKNWKKNICLSFENMFYIWSFWFCFVLFCFVFFYKHHSAEVILSSPEQLLTFYLI